MSKYKLTEPIDIVVEKPITCCEYWNKVSLLPKTITRGNTQDSIWVNINYCPECGRAMTKDENDGKD